MDIGCPTGSTGLCHLIAIRHPKLRHPVQGRATYQQLRGLPIEAPRRNLSPEDRLDPKGCSFSQRTSVVARLFLPGGASHFTNPPQVLIASQTFLSCVAVPPNLGIAPWWDHSLRLMLLDRLVTIALVISTVAGDLVDLCGHLIQKFGQHLAIRVIIG